MTDPSCPGGTALERSERIDQLFSALADEQRRQVVRYFQSSGADVASVETLVDHALANGSGEPTRDQLKIALCHVALPKLAQLAVVEYDDRSQTVRYRGSPALDRVLDAVTEANVLGE